MRYFITAILLFAFYCFATEISDTGKAQIKEKAEKAGITATELIIKSVLGKKMPMMGDTELMREYAAQLGKIGSNLNQIAKRLNGGEMSYQVLDDTEDAITDFVDLKFRIMMALEEMCGGKGHKS